MTNWLDNWKKNMDYFQTRIMEIASGTKNNYIMKEFSGKPKYPLNWFRLGFLGFNLVIALLFHLAIGSFVWSVAFYFAAGMMVLAEIWNALMYLVEWGKYLWTKLKR